MTRRLQSVHHLGGYGEKERELRIQVRSCREAELVTSQLHGSSHAPTLDLDHPVAQSDPCTMWIETKDPRRALRALSRLARLGHIEDISADLSEHARRWGEERERTYDLEALDDVLCVLGAEGEGSLEEILAASEALTARRESELRTPLQVRWKHPVNVVRSRHHHHLYVHSRLSWKEYQKLLFVLRSGGVLERAWVRRALKEKESTLRVPWQKKLS